MDIDKLIAVLLPKHDDEYVQSLRDFFLTVTSITDSSFVGFDITDKSNVILEPKQLKEIFESYKGKTTKESYEVKAFLASSYVLTPFDIKNPSLEWQWISKLCHLLLYFANNKLTRRISETSVEARKWLTPKSSYQSLWQSCYTTWQADTLERTYRNVHQQLQIFENANHPSLSKLQSIYRTLEFAYHHRQPITRKNQSRKSQAKPKIDESYTQTLAVNDIDDDTDKLVEVREIELTQNDIDALRERLDDNLPTYVILEQSSIKSTEKYSPKQIQRRTKAKVTHANRNELFSLINIRHLPPFVIQNVCRKLWQYFHQADIDRDKKRAVAYLLLSLHTGYSIQQLSVDINNNEKKIVDVSNRTQQFDFFIKLDITPLRIRQIGIENVLANRLSSIKLPLPHELASFLAYKGEPMEPWVDTVISELRQELVLPYLSLARIEKSLYTLLIYKITTPQIASIITGRNARKRADLSYTSQNQIKIYEAYQQAIEFLNQRSCLELSYFSTKPDADFRIGSQNTPEYSLVQRFFEHLHKQLITQTHYIDKFNAYSLWLWHVSLILTSVRAVEGAPGFLKQFNLSRKIAWIQDKEERATTNAQRLVPICDFLVKAIQDYLEFLSEFSAKFGRLNPALAKQIEQILQSKRPLINWLDTKGNMESMRPGIIQKQLAEHFKFKADWTRHVGQRFLLEQQVDEAIISAIFAHEMFGQETWQKHSSMSVGDIIAVRHIYDDLAQKLQLQQIA